MNARPVPPRRAASAIVLSVALAFGALLGACPSPRQAESIDRDTLPPDMQADYDLFALRCSKCHSLARPLDAAPLSDEHWRLYVAKMRRQPASGIGADDVAPILRFLHYWSQVRADGGVVP